MPPGNPVTVNLPVLGFTASLAVTTAFLFGLVPALKASRVDLMDALRVSAQTSSLSRAARTLRRAMVVAEVALSLALLVGAGLLIRSVGRLASVPLGFRADRTIAMVIDLPKWAYPAGMQRARFYHAVLDRTTLLADVDAAAFANSVPPDRPPGGFALALEDAPEPILTMAALEVGQVSISPEYFRVMGVSLELGRAFDDRDNEKAPAVAIVNEALARKYFPHENPIGKRIKLLGRPGADRPWLIIVGVAANLKHQNFFKPMGWEEAPAVFRPLNQDPPFRLSLVFRTRTGGTATAATIQKQIAQLDTNVPTSEVQTIQERLSRALSYPHLRAVLLTAFAGLALLLAAVGLYAVLAQLIAQRTQEFGVRRALGAQGSDLLKLVIREGLALTCAGLAVGLLIATSFSRLLTSFLYGVKATDPLTLAGVSLLLILIALLATSIPARRASRVDPLVALRYE
jgi:putative ABC transport system permease protein